MTPERAGAGAAAAVDSLAAGGTLSPAKPGPAMRAWLVAEMAALFIVAPLAMREAVHAGHVPLFMALTPVLVVVVLFLLADRRFALVRELRRGFGARTLLSVLAVFAVGAAAVSWWVLNTHPGWFLEFPRHRPETFKRIVLAYPFLSVLAQEIVYRTFFFHRYGPLFAGRRGPAVLFNGALFGFAHIVVGKPEAMAATCLTGWLFAWRYVTTRSLWAVWLEHTLWGWLVFTAGIGRFFFTGVAW